MIGNNSFELKALKKLHAKVYIVDGMSCLVTSGNLTVGGMETNLEVGVASQDSGEISELMKEINKWFAEAKPLDEAWLKETQKQLLEFKKNEPIEPSFGPTNYPDFDEDEEKNAGGEYRELLMPEAWKQLLDSLKETEIPTHHNYLMVNDLIPAFDRFFGYIGGIREGGRHQENLANWLIRKQTLASIGDEKTRESVSRKIGNRKDVPENVWNSEEGEDIKRQVSLFLGSVIGTNELRVSDVLSTKQLQPLGLSLLDLCQFLCGMIENKFIVGNYRAEITSTNQFLIFDKEIYSILNDLDRIFRTDYRNFMELEKFCQLGELEKVDNLWFYPGFGFFEKLYLTKNGKIGSRNWSVEKLMEALAWELADNGYYYWHFSEMRGALKYLFPARFGKTSVRYVASHLASSPDKFHFAGSKGYWQLTDLGDGYHTNKDAIVSVFHRAADSPLHFKEIIKELGEMGRRVNEGSIYALLDRDEAFENLGQGKFRLVEKVNRNARQHP